MGIYSFEAAGAYYYRREIESLGRRRKPFGLSDADFIAKNSSGRRCYQFSFTGLSAPVLLPEPDNPADPNAIAVMIDGVKVGHVPREMCQTVHAIIHGPYSLTCKIYGGAWKRVSGDQVEVGASEYTVQVNIETPYEVGQPYRSKMASFSSAGGKSKVIALILCILFGYLGIHYFYIGRIGMGILYLFTFGLFGIGWIVDIIRIALGSFRDKAGVPLK